MTLDTPPDLCQSDAITAPVPSSGTDAPCYCNSPEPETEFKRGGARSGAGRPTIQSERQWETDGVSRATYYRLLKPTTAPAQLYSLDTLRWCVYASWGQAETSSASDLTRHGYETYCPLVAIRRRDRVIPSMWHTVREPYFPGYVFIRLTQTQSREPINATRGVREVLRRPDGQAAWVPDSLIEKIRGGDEKRLVLPKAHAPILPVRTLVRVIDGAFTSFPGTVIECDGVKTCVGVEIFGRVTPVWLDRVGVEVV